MEDSATVVVEQHDRQGELGSLRGHQAADVVSECHVADQQDDRTVPVAATPNADEIVPSIPFAPLLDSSRGGDP